MKRKPYKYLATSLCGFIQQVAIAYVGNGKYFYYYKRAIKPGKDATKTDEFWVNDFPAGLSRWAKARRKQKGISNYQYIRFESVYLVLASRGDRSEFRKDVGPYLKNCRKEPIRVGGYSISWKPDRTSEATLKILGRTRPEGHVCVRLTAEKYKKLKAYALSLALKKSSQDLEWWFWNVEVIPFAPVKRQMRDIFRAVNKKRKCQGLMKLDPWCLKRLRRQVFPFQAPESKEEDLAA